MHQLTEVDKCVILAIGSGALGGLICEILNDVENKIKNQSARDITRRIKSYVLACFFYGILMGAFTFAGLMFDTTSPIQAIQDSKEFVVLYGIIGLPLITIFIKLLEPLLFKSQNN